MICASLDYTSIAKLPSSNKNGLLHEAKKLRTTAPLLLSDTLTNDDLFFRIDIVEQDGHVFER